MVGDTGVDVSLCFYKSGRLRSLKQGNQAAAAKSHWDVERENDRLRPVSHHFKHISRDWTPRGTGRETYFLQMSRTEPESVLLAGVSQGETCLHQVGPAGKEWALLLEAQRSPKLHFLGWDSATT